MRKVLVLLCVLLFAITGCDNGSDGDNGNSNGSGNGGDNNQTNPQPDLAISDIQVFPTAPTAGQSFTLNIYVRNDGNAASGEYDVAIFIEDIDGGGTYPVGTFRNAPMQPGENYPVYNSSDRLVNSGGRHRVVVEIVPFNFEDGDSANNTQVHDFVANN